MKKIFSLKLAQKLINEGHMLIKTEPNTKKPWLSVFVFMDTEELEKDITSLNRK